MSVIATIPVLVAADWWEIAAGAIFFVLYGLGQLLTAREEAQKKKARKGRPKPQPPKPQAGAPARPANQADPLRAEVEEFLRRAEGKPAQRQRPAQPKPATTRRQPVAPQKPVETRSISRPLSETTRQPSQPARPTTRSPKTPQPLQPVDLRRESVVEHVARHVSTRNIEEHTSHLGEEVAQADEQLESHLQEAFSHTLGSLQHREQEVVVKGDSIAEELHDLLSQPAGMRQMIVASEILNRPKDRW